MTKKLQYIKGSSPVKGKFIKLDRDILGYKNVYWRGADGIYDKAVVTMIIPQGTIIYKGLEKKCRAEKADVIKIRKLELQIGGNNHLKRIIGDEIKCGLSRHTTFKPNNRKSFKYDKTDGVYRFIYTPGITVTPDEDFSFVKYECQSGIHFFEKIQDAIDY